MLTVDGRPANHGVSVHNGSYGVTGFPWFRGSVLRVSGFGFPVPGFGHRFGFGSGRSIASTATQVAQGRPKRVNSTRARSLR